MGYNWNKAYKCLCFHVDKVPMCPWKGKCQSLQPCPTLCDPVDCSSPGSSVHGIFQARILEWVAISFSRGSFRPRDQTWVSCVAGRLFTIWGKCVTLFQITLVLTGDVSSGMPKLLRNMSMVLSNKKVRIRAPELTWEPHYNKWWIQQRQSSRGSRFLELSWNQCYQSLEQTPPLASQNPSLILSCTCHTNHPRSELISISPWVCTPPPAASHSQTT